MSLDTSFYYRLTNRFQGPGESLDVHSDGSRRLKMAPTADYSGQYWKLVDLGSGKYALRTDYLGDCFSLDVINDGKNETPWLYATGKYSGQSWSLAPWGDGTFKLWNDFTGSGKSLNVYAGSFEPFVGTGDHSGQHWVLTPIRKISHAVVPDLDPRGNPSHNEGPSNYTLYLRPLGTLRAVMLFVDFPDTPAGSYTTQQAADHVLGRLSAPWPGFPGKRYAAQQLFHDESYGKLTLDVDVRSDLGWKRMPKSSSSTDYDFSPTGEDRFGAQRNYITDAARLFTPLYGPKVIFGGYSIVYIVPPKGSKLPISPAFNAAAGSGAGSITGEIRLAVTLGEDIYQFRYITLVHETGHLFDLPDLYMKDTDPQYSKVGPWDIMCDTFRAGSFLGWHRHKNGWVDPSRQLYISQTTPGWYVTVSPLSGSCGTSMVVLPVDDPVKPAKVFVVELAPPILGRNDTPRPAKGILVYTVDATIPDQQSPLAIIPKSTGTNDEYGFLCDAAYDVGDHMSVTIGGASLAVEVIQKIGDCYNIKIVYSRH
jgi:hypothetical protein